MNNRLLTDNIFTEIILFYIEVAYKVIASNNKVENNPISHFLAVEFDRISKSVYMDNNIFSKLEFENENKGLINIARDASNSNTPSTVEIRKM